MGETSTPENARRGTTMPRSQLLGDLQHPVPAGIVLLHAPAGSGKTTFMRQLREQRLLCARHTPWISLVSQGDDLDSLLTCLRLSFLVTGSAPPCGAKPVSAGLRSWESLPGWSRPFTLFIDDFERLRSRPGLNLVQQLLDSLPEHGEVIIGSRTYPQVELGRFRAQGRVHDLTGEELRFSAPEVGYFMREIRGLSLPNQAVVTLAERTEGWATALSLAALAMARRGDCMAFVNSFSGSNLALAEFLAQEVLGGLDESLRSFLLDTSVLPYLEPALCNVVTQRNDSATLLEKLVQMGLFVTPVEGQPGTLRYHGLFSSFLQATCERERPGLAICLHRRAASWFVSQGQPHQQIEHLLSAGDLVLAMQGIALHGRHLVERGSILLLWSWLARVPATSLHSQLPLRLLYAWSLVYRRRCQQALTLLDDIQSGEHELSSEHQREMNVIRCLAFSMSDRIVEAHRSSAALIEEVPATQVFHYTLIANILAVSLIAAGSHDAARKVLQRAVRNSAPERTPFVRSVSDSLEGCIDLSQGRLGIARARLKVATDYQLTAGESRSIGGRASTSVLLAVVLYEADECDEARRVANECIPYARAHGSPGALVFLFLVLARLAYADGDRSRFHAHLADLEQCGREMGLPRAIATAWLERARAATLESDFPAAHQAMQFATQPGAWPEDEQYCMHANEGDMPDVAAFRLLIAEGQAQRCLPGLRQAIRKAADTGRHRRALRLRILLCLGFAATGSSRLALSELSEVLRFASAEGFYRALMDEGPMMANLLRTWLESNPDRGRAAGVNPRFVTSLMEKLGPGSEWLTKSKEHDLATAEPLTWRERDVLTRLAAGHSNRTIADQLFISESTVKTHLRSIYGKLGTNRRLAAVTQARRMGLVTESC